MDFGFDGFEVDQSRRKLRKWFSSEFCPAVFKLFCYNTEQN
jgi:hypothetical protein